MAIIAHKGTLNGGHFWTYIKKDGAWYKMNDSIVKSVPVTEVESSQAYMIFYEKQLLPTDTLQVTKFSHKQES